MIIKTYKSNTNQIVIPRHSDKVMIYKNGYWSFFIVENVESRVTAGVKIYLLKVKCEISNCSYYYNGCFYIEYAHNMRMQDFLNLSYIDKFQIHMFPEVV